MSPLALFFYSPGQNLTLYREKAPAQDRSHGGHNLTFKTCGRGLDLSLTSARKMYVQFQHPRSQGRQEVNHRCPVWPALRMDSAPIIRRAALRVRTAKVYNPAHSQFFHQFGTPGRNQLHTNIDCGAPTSSRSGLGEFKDPMTQRLTSRARSPSCP